MTTPRMSVDHVGKSRIASDDRERLNTSVSTASPSPRRPTQEYPSGATTKLEPQSMSEDEEKPRMHGFIEAGDLEPGRAVLDL